MQQSKIIKCIKCGKPFEVRAGEKKMLCPHCSKWMWSSDETVYRETLNGTDGGTANKEVNASLDIPSAFAIAYLGHIYPIKEGVNTIGRKEEDSMASIQIESAPTTMSRHHLKIEMQQLASGRKRLLIKNWKNRNATLVNGTKLDGEDIMVIKSGAEIKIGNSVLKVIGQK